MLSEGMGDSLWGSLIAFQCGSMKSDRSCEVGVTMLGDAIWCGCVQWHVGVSSQVYAGVLYVHACPIMYVCTYPSRCAGVCVGACAGVHFICSRLSVQLLMLPW